jgi:hypothetical protein
MARPRPVGQDLFITDAWRSFTNPQPSLGQLWASDQPHTETSAWQHSTHKGQKSISPAGIEFAIPTSENSDTYTLHHVATTR